MKLREVRWRGEDYLEQLCSAAEKLVGGVGTRTPVGGAGVPRQPLSGAEKRAVFRSGPTECPTEERPTAVGEGPAQENTAPGADALADITEL
ncbi:hypothetical protein NDU88_011628 [Pleurodeles waltl]|uniref:Uncharacterized protein n=1 Tax=Pleurodeles waltl TaxID=8319 RepID=A0AAV7S2D2_PLEWA|nr:hypothetical protein NDU88_011628 [Pleurodeles waltl]